jgi:hypothetical protein
MPIFHDRVLDLLGNWRFCIWKERPRGRLALDCGDYDMIPNVDMAGTTSTD